MSHITNDKEFRRSLSSLDMTQQRVVAARFVEHVLQLSNDKRLNRVVQTALDKDALQDELSAALKSARAATIDQHARCGAEGNWTEQAGYFIGRAAIAAVASEVQSTSNNAAWAAAMSCRMAQTSISIDDENSELSTHSENEWQYKILSEFLN